MAELDRINCSLISSLISEILWFMASIIKSSSVIRSRMCCISAVNLLNMHLSCIITTFPVITSQEKFVYAQLIFASKTIDTSHQISGANNFFYSNITNPRNNKKAAVYLVLVLAAADLNAPKDSISYLRASEYNFEDSKPSVMLPETKLFL